MEDKKVTAEELKRALEGDFDRLAEEVAEAMNASQAGRIIADSEEPVRDAGAVFRWRMYEQAFSLLQKKQEAFSPSGQSVAQQGPAKRDTPDDQRSNRD